MENLVNRDFWRGRRVFLTGHTGFKGSWLALWLQELGAEVTGFALPPPSDPNLFSLARVASGIRDITGDIRQPEALAAAVAAARPQVVLHLAAQSLVGEGYRDPAGTYGTNVMGTLHLLEAVRKCADVEAVVVVTTDKCYENREWPWAYREDEPLGGHDPYSSSKACAEVLTASWRRSFFRGEGAPRIATARAGNVIGGGDWATDRLVPDLLAAFAAGRPASIRHPQAVRPWQHVLEPLAGYLLLAQRLVTDPAAARAWNFGPGDEDCVSVGEVAGQLARLWQDGAAWSPEAGDFPHEAGMLRLDSSLARQQLHWRPRWRLPQALARTVDWQRAWLAGKDMRQFTLQQIHDHLASDPSTNEH